MGIQLLYYIYTVRMMQLKGENKLEKDRLRSTRGCMQDIGREYHSIKEIK